MSRLGPEAKAKLRELSAKYPHWQLAPDGRDEFFVWNAHGDDAWDGVIVVPHDHQELVEWLKSPQATYTEDVVRDGRLIKSDWRDRCRVDCPTVAGALRALARDKEWNERRWREALSVWSEGELRKRSWCEVGSVLVQAPDTIVACLLPALSTWLNAIARVFEGSETKFLALNRRILALEKGEKYHPVIAQSQDYWGVTSESCNGQNEPVPNPLLQAINHPVGHCTQALLQWWSRQGLAEKSELPQDIRVFLTELCNTKSENFRHGRVLLAGHVVALFLIDEAWTQGNLLPLFSWSHSQTEARIAWEGFLHMSPGIDPAILPSFKGSFLETAQHCDRLLPECIQRYARHLTFMALAHTDTFFTRQELADATSQLPEVGLESVALSLVDTLQAVEKQRSQYWQDRVLPYLDRIWPKSQDVLASSVQRHFERLGQVAQDACPSAMAELQQRGLLP